jgi:hypothetical protein
VAARIASRRELLRRTTQLTRRMWALLALSKGWL